MQSVDDLISERMFSEHAPLIQKLTSHLINAGGKRLRPLLTLASANICNYQGKHHIHLAAIVEFIHTATLLHDDVVDGSKKRRGKKTANFVWGNKSSILVGDYLFSKSFQIMVDDADFSVMKIIADASQSLAKGEVMQLSLTNNLDSTKEKYLKVIEEKTAGLFSAASILGGIITKQKQENLNYLKLFLILVEIMEHML